MSAKIREQLFRSAGTLVVKIGTNALSLDSGMLDRERISRLSR